MYVLVPKCTLQYCTGNSQVDCSAVFPIDGFSFQCKNLGCDVLLGVIIACKEKSI